jgi:pimeloyl-ACP methyl ester carboxylesterase
VYWPADNAASVEIAVRALAPDAKLLVGMSLGGLTALALTDRAPDLVRSLVLVDVTPGVNREKSTTIAQFIDGPEYFTSFDEILQRTIQFNPTRTESSLRRGVLHNAIELPDGTWCRRYDLRRTGKGRAGRRWPELRTRSGGSRCLTSRGSTSPVVDDEDGRAGAVIPTRTSSCSRGGTHPRRPAVELARLLDKLAKLEAAAFVLARDGRLLAADRRRIAPTAHLAGSGAARFGTPLRQRRRAPRAELVHERLADNAHADHDREAAAEFIGVPLGVR